MKIWEGVTSYGRDESGPYWRKGIHYFEQSWWRHAFGRLTFWLWMRIPGRWHMPESAKGDDPWSWQLRFELWCTWDMPNAGRRNERHVFTTGKLRARPDLE